MSVAHQAARGVAWNMLFGVSTRMLQLVGTLVLARLIDPDEYGAVLAASILVTTASICTSFALGQYLIAKRAPPEVAIQAMAVHIGLGVLAMGVVCALRQPLGEFFGTAATGQYVIVFSIAYLLDRVRYVPERLILRALRFRTVATINAVGELLYIAGALATVRLWGPWALVFGALVRSAVTCMLYFRYAPTAEWLAPLRFRLAEVRDLIGYGLPIMIGTISDQLATRCDNLIMSRMFDTGVMGRYNLSYSLAEMPVNSIAVQIGDVLMPAFSKMEEGERRGAVVQAAALMSLVVSPLGVGLAAVAPTVVAAFFNEKWGPAMATMLAILSVMSVFRPMTWSAIAYLQAVQKTRLVMYSSFFRAIGVLSMVGAFGYLGDEDWACAGAAAGFALHSVLTIIAAGRVAGFSAGAYLVGVARPLLPCAPMYIAVIAAARGLAELGAPLLISLVAQVAVGAIVYVAAAFVILNRTVRDLLRQGREAFGRRRRR